MASLSEMLKKARSAFGGKQPAMKPPQGDQELAAKLGKGKAREAGNAIIARKKATEDLLKELE